MMAATVNSVLEDELSSLRWGWILAYGILLLIAAAVVIANPVLTGFAVGVLLGAVVLMFGVAALVAGFHALSARARWTEILLGLVAVVAGLVTLFNPVAGALSLVWVIGIWLLVSGGFEVAFALGASVDRGWRLALGVLDLVLGLILVFAGPGVGLVYLTIMVAISFFMRGLFMIGLASALRKLKRPAAA